MRFHLTRPESRGRLVRQISLGIAAILLTTAVLTFQYIHHFMMSALSELDEKIAYDQFESAQSKITQVFDSLYSSINLLMYDGDILAIARDQKVTMDYDYYSQVKSTHARLANMSLNYSYIQSIYVYINDNVIISTDVTNSVFPYSNETIPILRTDFYREICQSVYRTAFSTGHSESDFHAYKKLEPDGESLITLACASKETYKGDKRVIMINVNARKISALLASCFGEDSLVCLLDADQRLLCTTDAAARADVFSGFTLPESETIRGQYPVTLGGRAGQAAYIQSEASGFTIVKYIPADKNLEEANNLGIAFLAVFFLCSAASILLVRCWIRRCLKPIDAICHKMGELEVGRLGVQIDRSPRNELGNVIRYFNRMSSALAEMDEVKRRTERSLRLQELHALRAQLNPHFIFNTLNMLKWMAVAHRADDLEECLVALAEILYPVFRENSETIPLRQEINCLRKYLLILSHRSGSRVDLNISLGEELEPVPVPRLIIQPIVENCVRHGCYSDGRVLTVNVMARSADGALEVSIADDGRGIDGDRLTQLRSSIESKETSDMDDGEHIGLSNVHRRIVLQYGRQYGLSIWSEPGKGATVTIRLPLPDSI